MNIEIDNELPTTFGMPPIRELDSIDEVVIHHTAGDGNWKGLKGWFLGKDNPRRAQYKKFVALTHYYIQKDGKIIEAYPLDTWLYHSCSGKRDKTTIGIELIHKTGDFTEEQYKSLFYLLFDFLPANCPNLKVISSHDYRYKKYSNITKDCPSDWFDWARLKAENKLDYEVHHT